MAWAEWIEMQSQIHFISGLPRSGSTLLAGIGINGIPKVGAVKRASPAANRDHTGMVLRDLREQRVGGGVGSKAVLDPSEKQLLLLHEDASHTVSKVFEPGLRYVVLAEPVPGQKPVNPREHLAIVLFRNGLAVKFRDAIFGKGSLLRKLIVPIIGLGDEARFCFLFCNCLHKTALKEPLRVIGCHFSCLNHFKCLHHQCREEGGSRASYSEGCSP